MEMSILSPKNDEYEPTDRRSERDYWSGEGHLVFKVISHDPDCPFSNQYEIEWNSITLVVWVG